MSTTYTVQASQIMSSALAKLGVLELGSAPDATTYANAQVNLNMMLKQWMTEGIKLWTVTTINMPFTASQTSYSVGPTGADLVTDRPLRLIQAWYRNTSATPNIDTPLTIISRQEYNILGSKFATGQANSIYLNPGVNNATVYVYVTPNTTSATNFQLYMDVQIPISDINATTDTPNLPQEWMMAMVWGLANELAMEYGVPDTYRRDIMQRAEMYRMKLEDWDVEAAPTFFTPDMRSVAGRM